MNPEKRAVKDAVAIDDLKRWCKCLSMELYDNGYVLRLLFFGNTVAEAAYKRPWRNSFLRSKAAAAKELIRFISDGNTICVYVDSAEKPAPGGAVLQKYVQYRFKIPKCLSPGELELTLAASGWVPPDIKND